MEQLKANELRIGNLILRNGFLPQDKNNFNQIVTSHNDITACVISPSSFRPILLTEEWLEKFGFKKERGESYKLGKYQLYYLLYYEGYKVGELTIKYVHQLQNIYFASSGEELTIKEL
jgi:hypothetical protein